MAAVEGQPWVRMVPNAAARACALPSSDRTTLSARDAYKYFAGVTRRWLGSGSVPRRGPKRVPRPLSTCLLWPRSALRLPLSPSALERARPLQPGIWSPGELEAD
eukprot:scaffold1921_cov384-Pinguiococcus_pyrenoidosus.AAC.4